MCRRIRVQATRRHGANGNHLALTAADHLIDVGLGDALHEPIPLVAGVYPQGPFRFRLRPSDANPGGWRFDNDPGLSFVGFDMRPGPVQPDEFAARHRFLMTSPDSRFVRAVTAQRRDATGIDSLKGRVLRRIDGSGETVRELGDVAEWEAVLIDLFGLALDGVDRAAPDSVWRRLCAENDALLAAGEG